MEQGVGNFFSGKDLVDMPGFVNHISLCCIFSLFLLKNARAIFILKDIWKQTLAP